MIVLKKSTGTVYSSFFICLSDCLYVCLYCFLFTCRSACVSVSIFICLYVCLTVYLFVYRLLYLSVYLFVCLSVEVRRRESWTRSDIFGSVYSLTCALMNGAWPLTEEWPSKSGGRASAERLPSTTEASSKGERSLPWLPANRLYGSIRTFIIKVWLITVTERLISTTFIKVICCYHGYHQKQI